LSGKIQTLFSVGFGTIRATDGKEYFFRFSDCRNPGQLPTLTKGVHVIFDLDPRKTEDHEIVGGDKACNIRMKGGAAPEVSDIRESTPKAASSLISQPFELKMRLVRSMIDLGRSGIIQNKGYGAVKKHADSANIILGSVAPETLSDDERLVFKEKEAEYKKLVADMAKLPGAN
jgi:cold shock CspA family protein